MEFSLILYLSLLILLYVHDSVSVRTSLKIYEPIQSNIFCFRRLNSTHQIGCASNRGGNIGIIHLIQNHEHLVNVTSNPLYTPFIPAIPIELFNMENMLLLKQSKDVQGVLILYGQNKNTSKKSVPEYFSPDQSCPNKNFGLYTDSLNPEYASCKMQQWNEHKGNLALNMMYEDWGMPIFIITNETCIKLIQQYFSHFNEPKNGEPKSYPLLAAQLKTVMLAAKDSETCIRRSNMQNRYSLTQGSLCDALFDRNIISTLFPTEDTEEVPDNSVVVVGCRLDTFSMFDGVSPGAHSTVTGLVTLLTIANTLATARDEINEKRKNKKNILFAIFNGESFDYIGSSRIVFDMERGHFPFPLKGGIKQPALLKLNHISHFIELSQLAPDDETFYVHSDPVSNKNESVATEVTNLFKILKDIESRTQLTIHIKRADEQKPLPPSSFQSFLSHKSDIPGVVVADHEEKFTNRYYNSMFDTNDTLNVTNLSQLLKELSTVTANMLYKILTDEMPTTLLQANESLVDGLLECYLKNASCNLFRQIANPSKSDPSKMQTEPYPMYISVASNPNPVTLFTRYLFAYLVGEKLENHTEKSCMADEQDEVFHYTWMNGPDINSTGICVKSTVYDTIAESPAAVLNDWSSTKYSTWTESIWNLGEVRIFLKPSLAQEIWTLMAGIIIFLFSIFIVYFFNERASIIFNTKPLVSC